MYVNVEKYTRYSKTQRNEMTPRQIKVCPKCDSAQVFYRKNIGTHRCKKCLHEGKPKIRSAERKRPNPRVIVG